MKIAVSCVAGETKLGPFGRGSDLFVCEIQDGEIVSRDAVRLKDGCCAGLARQVRGVDVVLCSEIGHGALGHLAEQGTEVARPKARLDDVAEVVRLWLTGTRDAFVSSSTDCDHSPCAGRGHGHHHHEH